MSNTWLQALKIWNSGEKQMNPEHKYHIPRKGTPAHAEVMETADFLKANPDFFKKNAALSKQVKATVAAIAKAHKKSKKEKK